FGAMFAPDQTRAAMELLRVTRPGGTIALASWTPDGFIGELFRTVGAHMPPAAAIASPMLWGTESHLRQLLGHGIASRDVPAGTFTFRLESAGRFVTFFRLWYGPTLKAFAALNDVAGDALEADLIDLVERHDRLGDGAVAVPAAYTEAIAVRR